jgi:hypothetical protein
VQNSNWVASMAVHACHPNIWEAEEEDYKFKASLPYFVSPQKNYNLL